MNGSASTEGLRRNLAKDDNKIIVTIQKRINLIKSDEFAIISNKLFTFDEHIVSVSEARKITKNLSGFIVWFTGTPIFRRMRQAQKQRRACLVQSFIRMCSDAIRDEKVLKFKVDYNDVRPKFKELESETDEEKLGSVENKKLFLHPDRIEEIAQHILNHFGQKTHRLQVGAKGFNAMFAVSSVNAAKCYYEQFKRSQALAEKPLKIATIFSYAANEEQNAIGDISDEQLELSAMDSSSKEFLQSAN